MLKALELFGFKSFADKTRLEFPSGISVVVGPNGSGKSNVVDSVKWALGSQSAKSLRGKEMTDVIFNGCGSRGPAGTGEVTLTLDNSEGKLAIDAKEVHITRRVYRSGEGEYLINRQPCRLRDIRELLLGGELIDAKRALAMGLVNRVVPRDAVLTEALKFADSVLQGAPNAILQTKRMIEELGSTSVKHDLELALKHHMQARGSAEAREGIGAFVEKRKPNWAG